jgi:hypothetical protein
VCDGHVDEVGKLSARGKCATCGDRRLQENHRDLVEHRGPWFGHWRRRTLAAFGVVEVDGDRGEA